MMKRLSKCEVITMNTCRVPCMPYHNLIEKDRMCSEKIDFPVAFCFGDRDFFGSEGADQIVKSNCHFESGRSQLFKLENAGHDIMWDNPYQLAAYMIGFFNGTITKTFDEKPRDSAVVSTTPVPTKPLESQ